MAKFKQPPSKDLPKQESGDTPRINPTILLTSKRTQDLLMQLSEQADVVLIDLDLFWWVAEVNFVTNGGWRLTCD